MQSKWLGERQEEGYLTGEEVEDSQLEEGSHQACFMCQEDSGFSFDRLIIRYRKNSTQ